MKKLILALAVVSSIFLSATPVQAKAPNCSTEDMAGFDYATSYTANGGTVPLDESAKFTVAQISPDGVQQYIIIALGVDGADYVEYDYNTGEALYVNAYQQLYNPDGSYVGTFTGSGTMFANCVLVANGVTYGSAYTGEPYPALGGGESEGAGFLDTDEFFAILADIISDNQVVLALLFGTVIAITFIVRWFRKSTGKIKA